MPYTGSQFHLTNELQFIGAIDKIETINLGFRVLTWTNVFKDIYFDVVVTCGPDSTRTYVNEFETT